MVLSLLRFIDRGDRDMSAGRQLPPPHSERLQNPGQLTGKRLRTMFLHIIPWLQ
ncbi:hypothetical protein X772_36190 [Mesorhizobium sp. LSJC280B00]|nr:hypothetical protein X772_36190 [Mesorhizobium sp. LSJC280B00]